MKKLRNAFFQESQMSAYNYFPNQNMNMINPNIPTQAGQASQSFYSGPTPIIQNNEYNDYEARLAKLERQLNRLEARINKIESKGLTINDDIDSSTNMYMI